MERTTSINKLTALSHGGRLDIFRLLVGAGGQGLNAGEISAALDLKPNTLSAHLTMLSSAELIRSQREGRNIRYFAEMSAMRELLGYLMQDCCGGNPEIVKPALDSIHCNGSRAPAEGAMNMDIVSGQFLTAARRDGE